MERSSWSFFCINRFLSVSVSDSVRCYGTGHRTGVHLHLEPCDVPVSPKLSKFSSVLCSRNAQSWEVQLRTK